MDDKSCDLVQPKGVKEKKLEVIYGTRLNTTRMGPPFGQREKWWTTSPKVIGSGTELMARLNVRDILKRESLSANGLLTMIKEKSIKQPTEEKNSKRFAN